MILHLFTRDLGWQSFITSVGGKSRPRAITRACTIVSVDFDHRENKELQQLKQVQIAEPLATLHSDVVKSAVAMFIAELLMRSLHRDYQNTDLYDHIEELLIELDRADQIALFPIRAILHCIYDLGFGIPTSQYDRLIFDPVLGQFEMAGRSTNPEDLNMASVLNRVLTEFNMGHLEPISSSEMRKKILQVLLDYLKERLDLNQSIKSHEVLEVILHS